MSEYVSPYMYLDGNIIEVEKVVSMAINAGSYQACEHYMLHLMWHLEETNDTFLKRQIQNIRAYYKQSPFPTPPVAPDQLPLGVEPENRIFVSSFIYINPDGEKEYLLGMSLLLKWIKVNFLPLVIQKYDWFALWRFLKDKDLLRETKVSRFVNQMTSWFPSVNIPAQEDAINLYKRGYLGDHPYNEWNKDLFLEKRNTKKQSEEGFDRLLGICFALAGAFRPSFLELSQ